MKLIVYLLIFQFSIGAMMPLNDFNQLSKLSFLIQHYKLHQYEAAEKNESFTAIDFIYLHYISPDQHTHDVPYDHSDLPLQEISVSMNLVECSGLIVSESIDNIISSKNYFYKPASNRIIFNKVFHPPLMS